MLQHFARSLIFMKHFFFIINFQKEKANTFTLLIILIVKSLQIELLTYIAQICYYDPQSAGINVQSPQSATTPRRLTLVIRQYYKIVDKRPHNMTTSNFIIY